MAVKNSQEFRKLLGLRIRTFRKAQKISQAQLGYEVGVSRETINLIESGKQNGTTDLMFDISVALGLKMKELYDFEY